MLDCPSKSKCQLGLDNADLELVYFYCHGKRALLAGTRTWTPYLEVGQNEKISPSDISVWYHSWPADHWQRISPLVFINGCHTTELTPDLLVNFVDDFVGNGAAGVIGTEISLHQRIASEAAEEFFGRFSRKASVGEAIKGMRVHLLGKGNLMGLSYTPYRSSDLRLVP